MKVHGIFRKQYLFEVHCLCPSSLISKPKWQLCDNGAYSVCMTIYDKLSKQIHRKVPTASYKKNKHILTKHNSVH